MIKSLTHIAVEDIVDALHDAFSDYAIPIRMPVDYWKDRWLMANIDYDLSFGYFDDDTLAGFVLHGIDHWQNEKCFYNMATGVRIPYRGQRIVQQIYEAVSEPLKSAGCTWGCLEVLCDNTKAIKAYQSSGFDITDEMWSFHIPQDLKRDKRFSLSKCLTWQPEDYDHLKKHKLSFEHRDSIILRKQDAFSCYELKSEEHLKGFAIVKNSNSNVVQFGVDGSDFDLNASALFGGLSAQLSLPRLVNISIEDRQYFDFFKAHQFKTFISQYMMTTRINI